MAFLASFHLRMFARRGDGKQEEESEFKGETKKKTPHRFDNSIINIKTKGKNIIFLKYQLQKNEVSLFLALDSSTIE